MCIYTGENKEEHINKTIHKITKYTKKASFFLSSSDKNAVSARPPLSLFPFTVASPVPSVCNRTCAREDGGRRLLSRIPTWSWRSRKRRQRIPGPLCSKIHTAPASRRREKIQPCPVNLHDTSVYSCELQITCSYMMRTTSLGWTQTAAMFKYLAFGQIIWN